MIGRRLPDLAFSEFHADAQAGDYWKILDGTGEPKHSAAASNLEGTCWFVIAPRGDEDGIAIGRLELHTVREHADGTVSVRRGDGSSNSIDIKGARGYRCHAYIEHGVWEILPDSNC
jgi:hypothetical protein